MSPVDNDYFSAYRATVYARDRAHFLAAERARRVLDLAVEDIEEMNFGEAKRRLLELIERGLPNDHGGPVTHYPFFEEALEKEGLR